MGLPRQAPIVVSQALLDEHAPNLHERFLQLAEKYQYRDASRAAADAILCWVEMHERPDTGRPPSVEAANADATLQQEGLPPHIPTPLPFRPDDDK